MLYMAAMKVDEGEQVAQAIAAFKVQLEKPFVLSGKMRFRSTEELA